MMKFLLKQLKVHSQLDLKNKKIILQIYIYLTMKYQLKLMRVNNQLGLNKQKLI